MTKRKAYAKPSIAVEDFVLNEFIAGSCRVQVAKAGAKDQLKKIPLYAEMIESGYFSRNIVEPCTIYVNDDDILCYHTQGGARGPLIAS